MITLRQFLNHSRPAFDKLFQTRMVYSAPDSLLLSALGARICYSADHPIKLLRKDPRVNSLEDRVKFLTRLYQAKHFSVFAHSPFFFVEPAERKPLILFKLWFVDKGADRYYCGNFRHLAEACKFNSLSAEAFELYLRHVSDLAQGVDISLWVSWEFDDEPTVVELSDYGYGEDLEKSCVLCFYIDSFPWGWFSFIIHGASRVFSHQLVRHTWLNFSQRSHRYTKVDRVVKPCLAEDLHYSFDEAVWLSIRTYHTLVELGTPKEDARFIAPTGTATTIMASGPLFVWQDFVEKRNHQRAQWEIRRFAQIVDLCIKKCCPVL